MLKTRNFFLLQALLLLVMASGAFAQPTWTLDPFGKEKKPEQYEEKKLASEKTGEKKFTTLRRFAHNTTTHYNYYFNANNKINNVIARAKAAHKDDYTRLMTYYPYTLEETSAQKTELDSVIYKATGGILLHDLRSDWVDNMYLLVGKAYYLRNEMDSAAMTFQFINYNLFPRKKKEDDSRVVGTNNAPGTGYLSIANKENRNLLKKITSLPPSRNDALIWLARTFTSKGEYGDAAGLINILRHDPQLPARLKNDLAEVTGYWFFAQNNYDSASHYLAQGLSTAPTAQDRARWEFLLAQMNELNGNYDKASEYYQQAAKHTVDPVMEIYANLNEAKMMKDKGDTAQMEASIARLVRMAKKDKYDAYRDIIYYSAAQISLQKPDTADAVILLEKSLKYNTASNAYKTKSFEQLADIYYSQQRFKAAYAFYDSVQIDQRSDTASNLAFNQKKEALAVLVKHIHAIEREDSLQRIAAMPEEERIAYVKKILRKLRKEQGLKEEDASAGTAPIRFENDKEQDADLFGGSSKGEWYFYNSNARSKGYNEFVTKWGKRSNVDNWRRVKGDGKTNIAAPGTNPDAPATGNTDKGEQNVAELSVASLLQNLPLTPAQLDSSNKIIELNKLALAQVFQNNLDEYAWGIMAYDNYRAQFPKAPGEPDALLGLYYCYSKLGFKEKAEYYKNLLANNYAQTDAGKMVTNPALLNPHIKSPEATARYQGIYEMFIEGKFSEAIAAKKQADSLFGSNYWTPQLLYIESIYHIRQMQDSTAINTLQNIISLYPQTPLAEKAQTLIDVLGRRKEITEYLTHLEITRAEEERIIVADEKAENKATAVQPKPVVVEPTKPTTIIAGIKRDSSAAVKPIAELKGFLIQPEKEHLVLMLLNKVDYVYVNETKNAFNRFVKGNYLYQNILVSRDALDADRALVLFSKFSDAEAAAKFYDKVKKAAPSEVSWLPANKYSFIIISESNLQLLKENKDFEGYKKVLNESFGNRF